MYQTRYFFSLLFSFYLFFLSPIALLFSAFVSHHTLFYFTHRFRRAPIFPDFSRDQNFSPRPEFSVFSLVTFFLRTALFRFRFSFRSFSVFRSLAFFSRFAFSPRRSFLFSFLVSLFLRTLPFFPRLTFHFLSAFTSLAPATNLSLAPLRSRRRPKIPALFPRFFRDPPGRKTSQNRHFFPAFPGSFQAEILSFPAPPLL